MAKRKQGALEMFKALTGVIKGKNSRKRERLAEKTQNSLVRKAM